MKVYRSIPCVDSKTILAKKPDVLGINYEASNLLKYGLCSPSSEFLRYQKNPRTDLNSFTNNGLAKYFYFSLLDALAWASAHCEKYTIQGLPVNFLVWELDLPDYLVQKYIGTGLYNTDRRIELKVPYSILYSYLSLGVDYESIVAIKNFFDKYYTWTLAPVSEVEALRKVLPETKIKNEDFLLNAKDEIYQELCFPIFMSYGLMIDEANPKWVNDAYDLAYKNRDKHHQEFSKGMRYKYENWQNIGHGDVLKYLADSTKFYQEENKELKRVLTKSGYSFKNR